MRHLPRMAAALLLAAFVGPVTAPTLAAQDDEDILEVVVVCKDCGEQDQGNTSTATVDVTLPIWMWTSFDEWWRDLPRLPDFMPPDEGPPEDPAPDCEGLLGQLTNALLALEDAQSTFRDLSTSRNLLIRGTNDDYWEQWGPEYGSQENDALARGIRNGAAQGVQDAADRVKDAAEAAENAGCLEESEG